jgi:omega-6 fatty acid desaturase (delta-12 desaturase)
MQEFSFDQKTQQEQMALMKSIAMYNDPDVKKSVWQIINSFGPYFGMWVLLVWSMNISYWLTLALAIPAAGFLVRIFIIFHDCGHGSFFKSQKANHILGTISGILVFTPYFEWRYEHGVHHATSGDLDRRGRGDVWTMTVQEFKNASSWKRLMYRVYRHPFFMLVFGPVFSFVISYRFANPKAKKRERWSVIYTNIALLAILLVMGFAIGFKTYLMIQLPVLLMAGSAGIWLFYVQHQYEGVYWQRRENWDFMTAALHGSSFYKLPKVLQWFSGNIGFHHIHHLSSRIPNYNLEKCHRENSELQKVNPVTLVKSLKSLTFRLYDEEAQKLVSFSKVK